MPYGAVFCHSTVTRRIKKAFPIKKVALGLQDEKAQRQRLQTPSAFTDSLVPDA
jgi:hypothetical protein